MTGQQLRRRRGRENNDLSLGLILTAWRVEVPQCSDTHQCVTVTFLSLVVGQFLDREERQSYVWSFFNSFS